MPVYWKTLVFVLLVAFSSAAWAATKPAGEHNGQWPYAEWSSAKAYTFNFFPRRSGVPYRIYSREQGWSTHIRSAHPLQREQAERALKWTIKLRGDFFASKCPFPRHAVVFFNRSGKPVGSVNVCFECGDVLVWPKLRRSKREIAIEKKQYDRYNDKGKPEPERLQTYDRLFSKWKTFFGQQLGLPLDYKKTHSAH